MMMTLFKQINASVRRYRRDPAGNVSVTFTLFLIPLCGLLAMAIGMGNGVLMQRTEQHAADSAAVAAATGNNTNCYDSTGATSGTVSMSTSGATSGKCVTTSSGALNAAYTPGYQLEAKAVAASFTQISGATVTPATAYCPGTTTGTYDCYKVTISRTAPLYFGSVVGISNMTPTAVAYARTGVYQNDCLVGTKTTGTSVSIQGNTDVSACYARGNAQIDCSGSAVPFVGVIAPSESNSCKAPLSVSTTTFSDPTDTAKIASALAAKAPSSVPCSTSILSLTWSAADANNTQYARVCSSTTTLKLSANLEIGSNASNRVLYVDNVSIDLGGHTLSATNYSGSTTSHTGTTVVGVNTTAAKPPFVSLGTGNSLATGAVVSIIAPTDDQADPFRDYALVVDPSISTETALNAPGNGNGANSPISFNILGVVFAPMSDLTLGGSNSSDFTTINASLTNCSSIVAYTIIGGGSKLSASGCSNLGYTTPKDFFASVALVQ